jgi:hypothetical protein
MWLGLILLPPGAATLAGMWQLPGATPRPGRRMTPLLQTIGLAALAAVLAVGLIVGSQAYRRGVAEPAGPPLAVSAEHAGAFGGDG